MEYNDNIGRLIPPRRPMSPATDFAVNCEDLVPPATIFLEDFLDEDFLDEDFLDEDFLDEDFFEEDFLDEDFLDPFGITLVDFLVVIFIV
jgi:hypothetical protein